MTRSDDQRLDDMREACDRIALLVARGRIAFDEDEAVSPAIERWLEVLAEAANRVTESRRDEFPTIPWKDITRLRIVLAHLYHRVEPEQVWKIATTDAPTVAQALGPTINTEHE